MKDLKCFWSWAEASLRVHVCEKPGGNMTHAHAQTQPNNSAICQSYSHVGTAEVDLINLPFIQTANYAQTHNHSPHGTTESWQRERKEDRGG